MLTWLLFGLSAWYFIGALIALWPVVVFGPVIVIMGSRELFRRAFGK
jgi:hypothetical protein